MRGLVLHYDFRSAKGTISSELGERFIFDGSSWHGARAPQPGDRVDFTVVGTAAADIFQDPREVIATRQEPQARSVILEKKLIAGVLAFFLGSLGIHKFYLGYTKQGIIMLLCTFPGVLFFFIPFLIISLIAFIEAVIYLVLSDEEFSRRHENLDHPWF